jgi:hypothetical protein
MKKLFALLGLLAVLLAGCGNGITRATLPAPTPTVRYPDLLVTLERTMCFGRCPVYSLTIYGDGRVSFDGQQFVAATGVHTSTLAPEQIQALVDAFATADYFNLDGSYTSHDWTDAPSSRTSITLNGKTKHISHYHGDNCAPQQLSDLENAIDTIANTEQWFEPRPTSAPTPADRTPVNGIPKFNPFPDPFACNEP